MLFKFHHKIFAGYKVVSFDTTPITSTYLVALIVGEYEYVEGESEEGIKVRVYTPLGKKEQVCFYTKSLMTDNVSCEN